MAKLKVQIKSFTIRGESSLSACINSMAN